VEEEKDFGRIGVALREGEEVEVVVANVEVLSLAQHMDLDMSSSGIFHIH
jgi:hypothetical protein